MVVSRRKAWPFVFERNWTSGERRAHALKGIPAHRTSPALFGGLGAAGNLSWPMAARGERLGGGPVGAASRNRKPTVRPRRISPRHIYCGCRRASALTCPSSGSPRSPPFPASEPPIVVCSDRIG